MTKRERGRRHHREPSADGFAELVDRAIATIPSPFREALVEVAIVIDDWPTDDQLLDNGLSLDDDLYGLYEGVPRTEWQADWLMVPNRITLFRMPLQEDFPDPDALADEVRITVIHELAHHMGIDDARLEELGIG
ncbi:MAG: metallopeptidase family protein [Chloroflexi bacterium]|nr:metallopeptidase family protein [Chloroflexota bacterium]